jgi:small subunit ribosomal protein S18
MSTRLGRGAGLSVARASLNAAQSPAIGRFASGSLTSTTLMQQEAREAKNQENSLLSRHLTRNWKAGDVYAPHDLSGIEAKRWKDKRTPTTDAFDALSINPLTLYKVR